MMDIPVDVNIDQDRLDSVFVPSPNRSKQQYQDENDDDIHFIIQKAKSTMTETDRSNDSSSTTMTNSSESSHYNYADRPNRNAVHQKRLMATEYLGVTSAAATAAASSCAVSPLDQSQSTGKRGSRRSSLGSSSSMENGSNKNRDHTTTNNNNNNNNNNITSNIKSSSVAAETSLMTHARLKQEKQKQHAAKMSVLDMIRKHRQEETCGLTTTNENTNRRSELIKKSSQRAAKYSGLSSGLSTTTTTTTTNNNTIETSLDSSIPVQHQNRRELYHFQHKHSQSMSSLGYNHSDSKSSLFSHNTTSVDSATTGNSLMGTSPRRTPPAMEKWQSRATTSKVTRSMLVLSEHDLTNDSCKFFHGSLRNLSVEQHYEQQHSDNVSNDDDNNNTFAFDSSMEIDEDHVRSIDGIDKHREETENYHDDDLKRQQHHRHLEADIDTETFLTPKKACSKTQREKESPSEAAVLNKTTHPPKGILKRSSTIGSVPSKTVDTDNNANTITSSPSRRNIFAALFDGAKNSPAIQTDAASTHASPSPTQATSPTKVASLPPTPAEAIPLAATHYTNNSSNKKNLPPSTRKAGGPAFSSLSGRPNRSSSRDYRDSKSSSGKKKEEPSHGDTEGLSRSNSQILPRTSSSNRRPMTSMSRQQSVRRLKERTSRGARSNSASRATSSSSSRQRSGSERYLEKHNSSSSKMSNSSTHLKQQRSEERTQHTGRENMRRKMSSQSAQEAGTARLSSRTSEGTMSSSMRDSSSRHQKAVDRPTHSSRSIAGGGGAREGTARPSRTTGHAASNTLSTASGERESRSSRKHQEDDDNGTSSRPRSRSRTRANTTSDSSRRRGGSRSRSRARRKPSSHSSQPPPPLVEMSAKEKPRERGSSRRPRGERRMGGREASERSLRKQGSRDNIAARQTQHKQQEFDEEETRDALVKHIESKNTNQEEGENGSNTNGSMVGSHLEFDPTAKNNVHVVASTTTGDAKATDVKKLIKVEPSPKTSPKPGAADTVAAVEYNKTPKRRTTITIKLPIPNWGIGKKRAEKPQPLDNADSCSEN